MDVVVVEVRVTYLQLLLDLAHVHRHLIRSRHIWRGLQRGHDDTRIHLIHT